MSEYIWLNGAFPRRYCIVPRHTYTIPVPLVYKVACIPYVVCLGVDGFAESCTGTYGLTNEWVQDASRFTSFKGESF
jgi:hypothetical protein